MYPSIASLLDLFRMSASASSPPPLLPLVDLFRMSTVLPLTLIFEKGEIDVDSVELWVLVGTASNDRVDDAEF